MVKRRKRGSTRKRRRTSSGLVVTHPMKSTYLPGSESGNLMRRRRMMESILTLICRRLRRYHQSITRQSSSSITISTLPRMTTMVNQSTVPTGKDPGDPLLSTVDRGVNNILLLSSQRAGLHLSNLNPHLIQNLHVLTKDNQCLDCRRTLWLVRW